MITVSAAIDALGGTAAVARQLSVLPSAVSNWRKVGYFPPGLSIALRHLARRQDLTLPDHLFRERTRIDRGDYRSHGAGGVTAAVRGGP